MTCSQSWPPPFAPPGHEARTHCGFVMGSQGGTRFGKGDETQW